MKRCVIFGAAPVQDVECLREYLLPDAYSIAADGGIELARTLGVKPDLIVADCDSAPRPLDTGNSVLLPKQKDDTDTFVAMHTAFQKGFCDFLLLGCLGGRMDHTVANLLNARRLVEMGAQVTLVDAKNEISVLTAGTYALRKGGFSVFSMTENVKGLCLSGVEYPLQDFTLQADNPLCVSNVAVSDAASMRFTSGVLLLIYAKD